MMNDKLEMNEKMIEQVNGGKLNTSAGYPYSPNAPFSKIKKSDEDAKSEF